jgi:hypothetical protein
LSSGGSSAPVPGDTIFGDTSAASERVEYVALTGGSWAGGDAAGYFLLSNWNGTVWTSGENFSIGSDAVANHGTITGTPSLAYATLGWRNNKPVLEFDQATNEVAMFLCQMPRNYAGGGITLTLSLMAAAATSGDLSFAAFVMSLTPGADDLDVKAFAAPNLNQAITVPGTSGETVDATIAFSDGADMDSVAAGEWFYLIVMRDAQDATNDDASGDAQLVGLEIKET